MDTEVFLKAVNNAKQNPTDPNSVEFVNRIQQGKYNNYLQYLGKPTFQDGQKVEPTMMDTVTNRAKQTIEHPIEALKGAGKFVAKTAVDTAGGIQDIGQGILGSAESAVTGKPLEQTAAFQPGVGFESLKSETPEGQAVQQALTPSNEAQAGGENFGKAATFYYGGGKELLKGGADLLKGGIQMAKETPIGAKVTQTAGDVYDAAKAKLAGNATEKTINAVNPDLTGKKLAQGYKEIVTSSRTATPSGYFSEQSLSPSERAIKLGERLSTKTDLTDGTSLNPIKLSEKNPIKSLKTLRTELTDTENKLTTALNTVDVPANKAGLATKFDDAVKDAPEEFRIGDASSRYSSVMNFAKKLADKTDDSIAGLRKARSEFDNQARTQFPSAFKDGAIDTRTDVGAAIKRARDIFNEHLYNTAPNGSNLQKLVGREADIFQAAESISAKAAKGEGKTKVQKAAELFKDHPFITTGAAGYGLYEIGKKLSGD